MKVSRVERSISLPLPFPWEEEALADSRNIGSRLKFNVKNSKLRPLAADFSEAKKGYSGL